MPRKTRGKTSAKIVYAAREQRRNPTPAEKILWDALRGSQLQGTKFRRQHPYNRFILDFFCVEQQLAIEVDGSVHDIPDQSQYDLERSNFLREQGIRIMRLSNTEIENNLKTVLYKISEALN